MNNKKNREKTTEKKTNNLKSLRTKSTKAINQPKTIPQSKKMFIEEMAELIFIDCKNINFSYK